MAPSMIKIGFIATGLIFSLSSTNSFAKEYYKWVDAKGSTHYTATPPPKSAVKKGKVNTYGATRSVTPVPSSQSPAENKTLPEQPTQNTTIVSGEKVIVLPTPTATPVIQTPPDSDTSAPAAR